MKVVIRADASTAMGTGHIIRCRTLALALKKCGTHIQFITRDHPGHLGDLLMRDGFEVSLLPQPKVIENAGDDYSSWLGVSQKEDAEQTIATLGNTGCDWLIVDHYGLDRIWEIRLNSCTNKLMVIDDLANRPHQCDLLLDMNYAVVNQGRYQPWVPPECKLLLGPSFALLRSEYGQYRETMSQRSGIIKRVLVFMGGSDNANVTEKVIKALRGDRLAHLAVDVVIGTNLLEKECVIKQANARQNTHIYRVRPHLADLMAKADLAVGGGGGTTWERLCMGLPSIVISMAENQVSACEALASSGLIRYLGRANDVDVASIESAILDEIALTGQLRASASRGQALLDGWGVNRIVEILNPTSTENLTLRPANAKDALAYFAWVNDPEVRASAIRSEPIDIATHLEWFNTRLFDHNSHLYVLEAGNLPVGQIRFEQNGSEATIDYSLDALVRGRGWASLLLKFGIEEFTINQSVKLKAVVKPVNVASIATFTRMGFIEQFLDCEDGNRHYYCDFSNVRNHS